MQQTEQPQHNADALLDRWHELASESLKAWTAEAEGVGKYVAERLVATQDETLKFLKLSMNAWSAIAPNAGADGQEHFGTQMEMLRQQFLQLPVTMDKVTKDLGELWRLYLVETQKIQQPWAESFRQAPWHFGETASGPGTALVQMGNLYWDAYERTFGRLLESPSLGHTRELHEDLLKGFDAWLEYRRASFEYQVEVAEISTRAFEQFMRTLVARAERGEPVQGVRQLMFVWIEVVDDVFAEAFRSEKYIRIQGRLVNSATAYRVRERELADAFLKTTHIASRSELDEAYRNIYTLRKEVKELKKMIQGAKAHAPAGAASKSPEATA